jgi:hypothetical protein
MYKTLIVFLSVMGLVISCSSFYTNKRSTTGVVLGKINGEPVIPRSANRIIIPYFKNFTGEPTVSEKLTLRVRELISMDSRLAVVSDNYSADLRLKGNVVLYNIQPIHYSDAGEPVRKRLRIVVSIDLMDLKREKEIFSQSQVQAFEIFSDVIPPFVSETQVRERVIENLARRVAVNTVSGWYTELMTRIEKGKK